MIAVALALCFTAVAARAEDILVIRDGTRRPGGESPAAATKAARWTAQTVARGLIAWVGLRGRRDAAPPAARDPLKDEFHLMEGRVVTGEFGGLSLGAVAIGDASFDRDEVAWIRFAGPEPAATPRPLAEGPVLPVLAFAARVLAAAFPTPDSAAFAADRSIAVAATPARPGDRSTLDGRHSGTLSGDSRRRHHRDGSSPST